MKIVGLTGGIGSGKTAVLEVFSSKGIPCYESDKQAKRLMQEDENLVAQIKALFGDKIFKGNQLDRKKLADLVFKDKSKLKSLNAIVHPAVQRDFQLFLSEQDAPYVVKEAAILFETGGADTCDAVILITAPESMRLERVMQRQNTDIDGIRNRMNHQWSDEKKIPLADFVINNINWDKTLELIDEIHQKLIYSS
ncbi:MAG: dephospho-CoA kinase [Flavobacteriaceae bacterium]